MTAQTTPPAAKPEAKSNVISKSPPGGLLRLRSVQPYSLLCEECGLQEPHHAVGCQWREK
jgi:hypothetical protein